MDVISNFWLIWLISVCRRAEGQLQASRFPLQIFGASTGHVDYECRFDRTTHVWLSSQFLASPSSWYCKFAYILIPYHDVWWSLARTFGSRIIAKSISLVILWYGTPAQCASSSMLQFGDCWSYVPREDTEISIIVRNLLHFSCLLLTSWCSESCEIWLSDWILVYWLGIALFPILPNESSALPTPLLPCAVFCHSLVMRLIWFVHINASA